KNKGRLIGLLNLSAQRRASHVFQQLTKSDPVRRMPLDQAERCLREMGEDQEAHSERLPRQRNDRALERLQRFCIKGAIAAGMASRTFIHHESQGIAWRNAHVHPDYLCQGLNIGSAGILLGLASLDTALGTALFRADICDGARWLASTHPYA